MTWNSRNSPMKPKVSNIALAAVFVVVVFANPVRAGIRVENATDNTLELFLMGERDSRYGSPHVLPPRKETTLNVSPGKYKVKTKHPNGRIHYLGWQDYSNHKITFRISLCAICVPRSKSETGGQASQGPVPIPETVISHSAGTFVCSKCGKRHTLWRPGWGKNADPERSATTDEHGVIRPTFDPYGTFRLGVSVIDTDDGVMITDVFDSPAHELVRVDGIDPRFHHLTSEENIITHVNGNRVRNTSEFSEVLAAAPRRVELTVFNTERGTARRYWTMLRD